MFHENESLIKKLEKASAERNAMLKNYCHQEEELQNEMRQEETEDNKEQTYGEETEHIEMPTESSKTD